MRIAVQPSIDCKCFFIEADGFRIVARFLLRSCELEQRPGKLVVGIGLGLRLPHAQPGLGQAEMWAGDLDAARRHLWDGIDAGMQSLGPNAADMLLAYNIMGTLEQKAKRFDAAKLWFQRLVECARSKYGNGSYMYAIGLANLATLERITGHYPVAEVEYREVIADSRASGLESKVEFAKMELNLGKILIAERRSSEAQAGARIRPEAVSLPA